jgi:outer membrane protein assembly factor BamA
LASSGVSDGIVPPEKRFYAGGSNSVRGFAQNRLGPQVLFLPRVGELVPPKGSEEAAPCTAPEMLDLTCDASVLPDEEFAPRPIGGTYLLEGGVEFRFPISHQVWEGATFLDFGQVWGADDSVNLGDLEFTPGFGVRYFSPIGPIRVDLAYRFETSNRYQVVTSQIRPFDATRDKASDIVTSSDGVDYVPSEELALLGPRVSWGKLDRWSFQRFQLHLSIGQAF